MRDENGRFIKGDKTNLGRIPSADQKRKQSEKMAGRVLLPEHKEKISLGVSKARAEGKTIGRTKGSKAWNKGKSKTNGDSLIYGRPRSDETKKRIAQALTGKQLSEKHKRKISEVVKQQWKDPENAKKHLVFNSPNKQEQKLMSLLNSLYPGEWKFVGDGQIIIDGKCPDFINVNGQKKIIELYGERWHQDDNPQDRIDVFKPFGYDTLVIWVRELQNATRTKQMLKAFCENNNFQEV